MNNLAEFKLVEFANLESELIDIIISQFHNITDKGSDIYEKQKNKIDKYVKAILSRYFKDFRTDILIGIESIYVDKVYRDSYYRYFSSKLKPYPRNSIKLSFFESGITLSDFRDAEKKEDLQKGFLGYYVIRPTFPKYIGRGIITPNILLNKEKGIAIRETTSRITVNGIKLKATGFPHASQDGEYMTCAETTIYEMMEYFGNHYPNYTPVLPHQIIEQLNGHTHERLIPSRGLNIQQIAFALKQFGFGIKVYHRNHFPNEFDALLSCYVESGMPLILALENRPSNNGHAVICNGREIFDNNRVVFSESYLKPSIKKEADVNNIKLHDFDRANKRYVFIDDNHRPYHLSGSIKKPLQYYGEKSTVFKEMETTSFIAPLYPRVYLEAYQAKNYIDAFLLKGPITIQNTNVYIRTFLASSRTYREYIAHNRTLEDGFKEYLLSISLPQFIWVGELTIGTQSTYNSKQANGIILLDATEPTDQYEEPLILAAFNDCIHFYNPNIRAFDTSSVNLPPFSIFERNLINYDKTNGSTIPSGVDSN